MKFICYISVVSALAGSLRAEDAWWNKDWTQRQSVTLDTGAGAAEISDALTDPTILVRLPYGTFQFQSARQDGGDIRFVAADGKTILPHQVGSYDSGLGEGFVWVKLPQAKPEAKEQFYLYYGNSAAPAAAGDAFDADTALVYHFSETGGPPADATGNKNNASTPGAAVLGAIVGGGLRPLPAAPVSIPNSGSLAWKAGQPLTISLWVKPDSLQENAVLLSRGNGAFRLLLDNGVPVIQAGAVRTVAGTPLAPAVWSHISAVMDGQSLRLFANGDSYTETPGAVPAMDTAITLGSDETPAAGTNAYLGEIDELTISNTARSAAWVKLVALSQGGSDASQRAISLGQVEGDAVEEQSKFMEHLSLFKDIAGNMMFDGWIAIGICAIMILVGWSVAIRKFLYLNSIEKGTRVFLTQWKSLATDLTALDPDDNSSVTSLGGTVVEKDRGLIEKSPLYHIYQIGSEEIRHRLDKDNNRVQGLSGRSIQAIRASLDAGLVHESHRLSDGLVYLTISIAGGPYVGLLGTVVGVMITFAIIARSGEVNVNSIAPGIASALLATVVGLVVAIPALFIYSYLNGRIKNSLGLMQVFIDEFVAKMAEFYRPASGGERDQMESK